MTGEIDLHGNIWPVGGLKQKLISARRNGIKKVFVPVGNKSDVKIIDPTLLGDLEVVFASRAEDVLFDVLLPENVS